MRGLYLIRPIFTYLPQTSTIILGASKVSQVEENLKALDILPKMSHDIYKKINAVLDNEPKHEVRASCGWTFLPKD